MGDVITLRKFNTIEEASSAIELLEKNKIGYSLNKNSASEEIIFAGNTLGAELCLNVKQEDYETARDLLKGLTELNIGDLDQDYYLFSFSDAELSEILQKPDEWSYNDYLWAQEILKQRGKEVNPATLESWKKKRLEFLAQPTQISSQYQITSYFFCLLGGLIGILMGTTIIKSRKILPNGQKVFTYDDESRVKGQNIQKVGAVSLILWIILLIFVLYAE